MFIKTSIFKKLLKEAYKNDNLSVGHSEKAKVYYIVGGLLVCGHSRTIFS